MHGKAVTRFVAAHTRARQNAARNLAKLQAETRRIMLTPDVMEIQSEKSRRPVRFLRQLQADRGTPGARIVALNAGLPEVDLALACPVQ